MSVIIALCNTGNVNYNHNIRVKQGIENTRFIDILCGYIFKMLSEAILICEKLYQTLTVRLKHMKRIIQHFLVKLERILALTCSE